MRIGRNEVLCCAVVSGFLCRFGVSTAIPQALRARADCQASATPKNASKGERQQRNFLPVFRCFSGQSLRRSAPAALVTREPLLVRFSTWCRKGISAKLRKKAKTIFLPSKKKSFNISDSKKKIFRVSRGRILRAKRSVLKFWEIRDYLCIFRLLRAGVRRRA